MKVLNGAFTVVSLIGFMGSVIFLASGSFGELGTFGFKVGFALVILFTILVVAAMASIFPAYDD